jgi:hypothetical protein
MQKDKLKMLNRVSFVSLLKNLAKEIDLPVERGELRLFTASRDSLIHQGCFYCQSAAQGPIEGLKIRQPSDEYCFMLSFLDRLLLRLLDYRGSYHDWYLREEQSVCERRPLKPSSSGQC